MCIVCATSLSTWSSFLYCSERDEEEDEDKYFPSLAIDEVCALYTAGCRLSHKLCKVRDKNTKWQCFSSVAIDKVCV